MKDQILYFFDPLCGWCFGFSSNMLEFYRVYTSDYEFTVVPGGMITGSRVGPAYESAPYISEIIPRLEKTAGVTFGEPYHRLLNTDTPLNSEPPSRAIHAFRILMREKTMEFAHTLQLAHFTLGMDYNDRSVYVALAKQFGIEPDEYIRFFEAESTKEAVQNEFTWARASGVRGYPTVVLQKDQKYYMLSNGYTTVSDLKSRLEGIVRSIPEAPQ